MSSFWPGRRATEEPAPTPTPQGESGSAGTGSFWDRLTRPREGGNAETGQPDVEGQGTVGRWISRTSSSMVSSLGLIREETEEALAPAPSPCPSLSWTQRLIGWAACLILGMLLEFGSFGRALHAVAGGTAATARFATVYSLGNLVALAGTFFLAGPVRQLRRMGRENRWVASLCFVASVALTLAVASSGGSWQVPEPCRRQRDTCSVREQVFLI